MRILYFALGMTALVLGIIGAFLPILPTVPFLLLAAYCFARSSKRAHDWLVTHPKLGPPINDWTERRAISRNSKLIATVSIIGAYLLAYMFGVKSSVLMIQVAVLSMVMLFIWTRAEA